ncbi:BIR protein, putative [Medicago truncatula]|uniref:BIR protein, putative n=1 Tax=Medicago truncatula TaxID=3880 RepID=A0A072USV9_MEDTR|nr:BIR protein, putative [Medicago truncatula]
MTTISHPVTYQSPKTLEPPLLIFFNTCKLPIRRATIPSRRAHSTTLNNINHNNSLNNIYNTNSLNNIYNNNNVGISPQQLNDKAFQGISPQQLNDKAFQGISPQQLNDKAFQGISPQQLNDKAFQGISPQQLNDKAFQGISPQQLNDKAFQGISPQQLNDKAFQGISPQQLNDIAFQGISPQQIPNHEGLNLSSRATKSHEILNNAVCQALAREARASTRHGELGPSQTPKVKLTAQKHRILQALCPHSPRRVNLLAMASCEMQLARRTTPAREASDDLHHSLWRGSSLGRRAMNNSTARLQFFSKIHPNPLF